MAETSYPVAGGAGVNEYTYELLMTRALGIGRVEFSGEGASTANNLVYADATGRSVKVLANAAYIVRGYRWESGPDVLNVPLAANTSGKSRIDRIVLRLDRATYQLRLAVLQGAPADTPVVPALTQTLASTGVYETPIGRVNVKSQAGTDLPSIAAADVGSEQRFLAPESVYGLSTFRGSANPIGRMYFEYDTGRLFMGAPGGDILVGENGPWTKLTAASGWTSDNLYAQRVNGKTYFQGNVLLSASDRAPGTDLAVCTLPAQFRPTKNFVTTVGMSPGQIGFCSFSAETGAVIVYSYPQTFQQGGLVVIGPFDYMATGVKQ